MVEAASSESSDEVIGEGVVGASIVSTTVGSDWSGVGTSMVSKNCGWWLEWGRSFILQKIKQQCWPLGLYSSKCQEQKEMKT